MKKYEKTARLVVLLSIFSFFLLFSPKPKYEKVKAVEKRSKEDVLSGIDISQYQGDIDWEAVAAQKKYPLKFVIIRATMGKDRKDAKFQHNWDKAKESGFIVGSYHYYDPDQNSRAQARNYLNSIQLQAGDFIPVVDIERLSNIQSKKKLKRGLKRWLRIVERRYGVKPMIYTGHSFFTDYLLEEFSDYPLWVAAYSEKRRTSDIVTNAHIHQFSEKIQIPGIKENYVDGNDIKRSKINDLLMK